MFFSSLPMTPKRETVSFETREVGIAKIHDISLPVENGMAVWPTHTPVKITQDRHLDRGDRATVSELHINAHTGTHVDAPCHFIAGAPGVDSLEMDRLIGSAQVVETATADAVSAEVLEGLSIPEDTKRLLIKTRNSRHRDRSSIDFSHDYVGITPEGARWLVDRGLFLVGIDALSVGVYDRLVPTHEILLGAGTVVVEGLNLNGIKPGTYELICLPLRLTGLDGAPARALLIEKDEIP